MIVATVTLTPLHCAGTPRDVGKVARVIGLGCHRKVGVPHTGVARRKYPRSLPLLPMYPVTLALPTTVGRGKRVFLAPHMKTWITDSKSDL
jgi:hypothetical protein